MPFFSKLTLCTYLLLVAVVVTAGISVNFPDREATIAFHVTITATQLPLLSRFLTRIYHPKNLYLLDFAPPLTARRYSSSANVHHRVADPYVEHGVSKVINVLDAMAYFLDRETALGTGKSFDYFMHCTPSDYPTVTPKHMRRLLGFAARQPSPPNFFHFAHGSQLPLLHKNEIDKVYYDFSLTFNKTLSLKKGLATKGLFHPDHSRRTMPVSRTEKHFVVGHAYVKLATDSILAKRLLMSLGDASHVFENFFGTLAANSGDFAGRLIRSTSLRCINTNALEMQVAHTLPVYTPRLPSIEFLRGTREPCLFAGPFTTESPIGLQVRDQIDKDLLIEPSTQGKPAGRGYHLSVFENLKRALDS